MPGEGNIIDEGSLVDVGKMIIANVKLGMAALHEINFLTVLALCCQLRPVGHGLGGTQRQQLLELPSC